MFKLQAIIDKYFQQFKAGFIKREDLISPIYAKSKFDECFTTITIEDSVKDFIVIDMEDARFQQFSTEFFAIGGISFKPIQLKMNEIELATAATPDEIRKTAIQFLLEKNNLDRTQSPAVALYLEQYLLSSIDSLHKNETFKGIKEIVPVGADGKPTRASAKGKLIDGFGTYVHKLVTDATPGVIKPQLLDGFATMPDTPEQHVEYIEDMYEELDEEIKATFDCFSVNTRFERMYRRGKKKKYNQYYDNVPVDNTIEFSDNGARVCGSIDQNGTNLIWGTTKKNAVKLVSNVGNVGNWQLGIAPGLKKVQAQSDYGISYGLVVPNRCFINGNFDGLPALN